MAGAVHALNVRNQILGDQGAKLTTYLDLLGRWWRAGRAKLAADRRIRRDFGGRGDEGVYKDFIRARDRFFSHRRLLGDACRGTPGNVGQDEKERYYMIRGYLVSVEGGRAVKRFAIGFGSGTSEMDTVVEGYLMMPNGLRKLGSGTLSSSGNKTPGIAAPAAIAIATGNPIGLIVVGGMKIYDETSGRSTLEGRA